MTTTANLDQHKNSLIKHTGIKTWGDSDAASLTQNKVATNNVNQPQDKNNNS